MPLLESAERSILFAARKMFVARCTGAGACARSAFGNRPMPMPMIFKVPGHARSEKQQGSFNLRSKPHVKNVFGF
jgi:hypothetical protein